jgi:Phosphotransferase enzyme family
MTAEPTQPTQPTEPGPPDWRRLSLDSLKNELGLGGLPEREFPTDGWSGARFTWIERPGDPPDRFVIKRTSPEVDWIAAATDDHGIREARVAAVARRGSGVGWISPYLGAAADGTGAAIVMPDLSAELLAWERPAHDREATEVTVVDRVLDRLAGMHASPWWVGLDRAAAGGREPEFPWCPLPQRLTLTARPTCRRHIERGIPAGIESAGKLLAGWDAFDRQAGPAARDLVAALGHEPAPLVQALGRLPSTTLHGDLKLANVAIGPGADQIRFIDWQMTLRAPIAVELGWLLVSNSASLPETPDRLLERYWTSVRWFAGRTGYGEGPLDLAHVVGDWDAQVDLAWIVGLLLRGWRKGLDAETGASLGSGVSGSDDLAEWSALAVEAAGRRL